MQPIYQIGTAMEGGYFAGEFQIHGEKFGLIVAPKSTELSGQWLPQYAAVPDAQSYCDGLANTQAMAAAGSAIAKKALVITLGENADWYIPSRDELELLYRHFKPTNTYNYTYRHGDNPSSIPTGYPYTSTHPAQTGHTPFFVGGAEAFETDWYWSSTQGSAHDAWAQYFSRGYQLNNDKDVKLHVRPVRRFKLNP